MTWASTRRAFLGLIALAPLAPGAAAREVVGGAAHGGPDASADLARALRSLFGAPEAARSLGEYYLAASPHEVAAVRLWAREIAGECRRLGAPEGLRRALAEARARDLRGGVVVVLQGWVLARAEARACALLVVLG